MDMLNIYIYVYIYTNTHTHIYIYNDFKILKKNTWYYKPVVPKLFGTTLWKTICSWTKILVGVGGVWLMFQGLLENAMAPCSSTLAWKIPWTEEPGRLQSMGSLGVGHDWATSLSLFTFMHWRREWQPTPVFLPTESQGWGSLVCCRLWGRTESDTTEAT